MPPYSELLITDRLVLRPYLPEDEAYVIAMGQDPLTMRHYPALQTPAQSQAMMASAGLHWARHGFATLAVTRRSDGAFLGMCGCKTLDWPHTLPGNVEVGWRFMPAAWGQGYATEAARAALRHGFQVSTLPMILSFTVAANKPSWSVMERLGLTRRPELDFDHPRVPDGHPLKRHIVYVAERERFAG